MYWYSRTDDAIYVVDDVLPSDQIAAEDYDISLVTPVYGYGPLDKDTGWKATQYASICFSSTQSVSYEFYAWFTTNFDYVGSDPVEQEVKTIINIYDQTGKVLLDTITFIGSGSTPEVNFTVTDTGCIFSSGGVTESWITTGDFVGIGLSSATATWLPGDTYTFSGGAATDCTILLYSVLNSDDTDSGSGGAGPGGSGSGSGSGGRDDDYSAGGSTSWSVDLSAYSGFGSFIVSVLGAFLSFSILPGVSFGGLISICLIIAIIKLFFSK